MVTIRGFQNRIVVNSMKVVKATAILLSSIFFIDSIPANESDFLRAEISNGLITAKIYLRMPITGTIARHDLTGWELYTVYRGKWCNKTQ